ncbi:hypothetical protein CT0861_10617, partial [Colletotrichum tofieldiae]
LSASARPTRSRRPADSSASSARTARRLCAERRRSRVPRRRRNKRLALLPRVKAREGFPPDHPQNSGRRWWNIKKHTNQNVVFGLSCCCSAGGTSLVSLMGLSISAAALCIIRRNNAAFASSLCRSGGFMAGRAILESTRRETGEWVHDSLKYEMHQKHVPRRFPNVSLAMTFSCAG